MSTATQTTESKKDKKLNLRYLRDKDREMVKGIFRYHECPGGILGFVFKAYEGDEVERYDLIDGQVYTVPLGVARHLNKNLWYPVYEYNQSDGTQSAAHVGAVARGGHFIQRIAKKVRRASFQSLEFVDIEDLGSSAPIITVENV